MKSAAIFVTLLASAALAQRHGRYQARRQHPHEHQKRNMVTEWVTDIETITVTELIDATETTFITPSEAVATSQPPSTSPTSLPGQVFEGDTTSQAQPTYVPETTSGTPVAAPTSSTSTSVYVPPPETTPSTTTTPTTTSSPTPDATTNSNSAGGGSSSGSTVYHGDLTYYTLGEGACAQDNTGDDLTENVVALSQYMMGTESNGNPMCGKTITISHNGVTTTATVVDKCMGCSIDSIDVSEKVFKDLLGDLTVGRTTVDWWFN